MQGAVDRNGPKALNTAAPPQRHFVGRKSELDQITQLAGQRGQICLVHGYAGMGKTQLLRAAAQHMTAAFPGGVLEVDLRGWSEEDEPRNSYDVVADFMRRLGYTDSDIPFDVAAREAIWRDHLERNHVLVILDNVHDYNQVAAMLPGPEAPSLVMISSRSDLQPGISDHVALELGPMRVEDSILSWKRQGVRYDPERLVPIAEKITPYELGTVGALMQPGRASRPRRSTPQ